MDTYQSSDVGNSSSVLHGNDTLHAYTHFLQTDGAWQTELPDMPVTLLPRGSFNQTIHTPGHWAGTVGLGLRSTLREALYAREIIPSDSFSLYIGTGFPRAGGIANGSIIFGGYDSSRFTEPVTSYNMTPHPLSGNPYQVTIQDITLDSLTRPPVSLVSAPFTAELSTEQYPLTLPSDVLESFISHTGAKEDTTTDNFNDNSLVLPSLYGGTLTIRLSSGLNITFPPEWLANASGITPISSVPASEASADSSSTSSSSLAILGAAYLSQVYLSSSPATQTFHLAPAIQIPSFISNVTWCAEDLSVPEPFANSKKKISWFQSSGFIGAVLGGVLGGGMLTLLGIWAASWILRKEKRERWFSSGSSPELDGQNDYFGAGASGAAGATASKRSRAKKRIVRFIPPPISISRQQKSATTHNANTHPFHQSDTSRMVQQSTYYQNAPTTATTATFPPESATAYPPKHWNDDDSSDGGYYGENYSLGGGGDGDNNGDMRPIVPLDGYNVGKDGSKKGVGRLKGLIRKR